MRRLTPRQYGKVKATSTPIRGYNGVESGIFYCLTCLSKDESLVYDESKMITKQIAFKYSLTCSICGQPICPEKHSKFLQRIADAKSKNGKSL